MQHKWKSIGVLMAAVVGTVLTIEGGYVNDPNDAGGATNHGITEQVAREHGYTGPMQSLPKGMAQEIYIRSYIEQPKFDRVLALSPAVGTKLVDAGVNAGPGRASRWLQQSLNDLSRAGRDYQQIKVDGAIGRDTLNAYAALEKRRGRVKACELTLKLLDGYQTTHYAQLAQGQANASFIVGWLDTRVQNVPIGRCSEIVQ
ncbi:glycoside hydrolase family 108 protein [Comamonas jiangduensis]|uniref:glycoside hydrolase family 108 protein n=1 Tax=Comamonas jiangduensis TaxID=1194168 RepID=UPI003BF8AFB6